MKRLLLNLTALALPSGFFWLGGYDFDHRGEPAFMLAWLTLCFVGAANFALSFPKPATEPQPKKDES